MSQFSFSIANEPGSPFRADVNSGLQALASRSSGASAPATTYAYQPWCDTTNGVLKQRNAANSGWIIRDTLAETRIISRASNTILGLGDYGCTFIATGTFSQTLTAAATLADNWHCFYRNDGPGVVTIDPNGAETIDGAATLDLQPGDACRIACNGSAFKTQGLARHMTIATEQASTSGTSLDFTGIPSGVKRISVMFSGVSLSGTSQFLIQLGHSGGIENTGYSSGSVLVFGTNTISGSTVGLIMTANNAFDTWHGTIILTLENASAFRWTSTGTLGTVTSGGKIISHGGSKALSAELDRIRITTANGTDTFDAGVINVMYE